MDRRLDHLENTLFGECRCEDDREIGKRRNTFADGTLVRLDICVRLALHQVPFVDTNDQPFLVLLNERIDIQILRFYASRRVNHEDTHVAVLDRADRTNDRVILLVFGYFRFLANTGGVHEVEVLAELVVPRVD